MRGERTFERFGLLKAQSGSIKYKDEEITNERPHRIVARGISHVPEGRMVFANLTVHENLLMGGYLRKDRKQFGPDFDFIFGMFPRLKERLKQVAGTLSGGEQQTLAIGRALMSKPGPHAGEPSLGMPRSCENEFQRSLTSTVVRHHHPAVNKTRTCALSFQLGYVLIPDESFARPSSACAPMSA